LVINKIIAKILQMWLQSTLMEAISSNQSAFLLVRYILNNIILTLKTISWAKKNLNNPLFFLNLDFSTRWIGLVVQLHG